MTTPTTGAIRPKSALSTLADPIASLAHLYGFDRQQGGRRHG